MSGRSGGPIHPPDVSTGRSTVVASLASVIVVSTGPVTWHDDVGTAIPAGPCRDCADVTPAQPREASRAARPHHSRPLRTAPPPPPIGGQPRWTSPARAPPEKPIVPGDVGECTGRRTQESLVRLQLDFGEDQSLEAGVEHVGRQPAIGPRPMPAGLVQRCTLERGQEVVLVLRWNPSSRDRLDGRGSTHGAGRSQAHARASADHVRSVTRG